MAIGEPMLLAYADTSGWRIYQRPTPLRPRQTVPLLLRSHPVPSGFHVEPLATGLDQPRLIRVAPNGDIFIAESWAGRVRMLRLSEGGDGVSHNEVFATGLKLPFGLAFFPSGNDPQWLYVANTDSVVRFHYRNGDLHANEEAEIVVKALPQGGHWTRDIAFSRDDTKMFISVGSASDDAESLPLPGRSSIDDEFDRADVLMFDPKGHAGRVYASGIRNCVSMAVNSTTGDLWCSCNEHNGLGDDLPPDYITRVSEGGFYGWPWFYIGAHEDPRHKGARRI